MQKLKLKAATALSPTAEKGRNPKESRVIQPSWFASSRRHKEQSPRAWCSRLAGQGARSFFARANNRAENEREREARSTIGCLQVVNSPARQ